ncbi:permease prefix domain 1-containing protein [Phytomonospora sp. NPDC050363]|uniref:permease prefix domain 1-containing protein n=1 Tax=Phytomonospora sp. NPDC050363 TaxID=3155642 RepID=UPI0033DA9347
MTTPTLTERYVDAVVRRIPADQRKDVADELRATIADTVEGRDEATPEEAERAVIIEMGDPIRLAAQYADRPLALIGPDFYPTYIRLLKMLLTTALPIVVVVVLVIDLLDHKNAGQLIGTGIGAILTVGGQMIAWLTVIFALIDRVKRQDAVTKSVEWTPDMLPYPRTPDKGGAAAWATIGWYTFLVLAIMFQTTAPYTADDGRELEILNPQLWNGWIWPIIAGLIAMSVIEGFRIVMRGWNLTLVLVYTAAEALFALPLAWIVYKQMILNPEFVDDVNGDWTTPAAVYSGAALIILAVSVTEVFKRFRALPADR